MGDKDGPFNGSDPYVWINLDGNTGRTAVGPGGSDPEWNETVVFDDVDLNEETEMRLRIYDSDWGLDDKIGECKIRLWNLPFNQPLEYNQIVDDGWFSDARMNFVVT